MKDDKTIRYYNKIPATKRVSILEDLCTDQPTSVMEEEYLRDEPDEVEYEISTDTHH